MRPQEIQLRQQGGEALLRGRAGGWRQLLEPEMQNALAKEKSGAVFLFTQLFAGLGQRSQRGTDQAAQLLQDAEEFGGRGRGNGWTGGGRTGCRSGLLPQIRPAFGFRPGL